MKRFSVGRAWTIVMLLLLVLMGIQNVTLRSNVVVEHELVQRALEERNRLEAQVRKCARAREALEAIALACTEEIRK